VLKNLTVSGQRRAKIRYSFADNLSIGRNFPGYCPGDGNLITKRETGKRGARQRN
jgi:hypothetical protein